MTREKKSMIGFDPLAWLDEERISKKNDMQNTDAQSEVSSAVTENISSGSDENKIISESAVNNFTDSESTSSENTTYPVVKKKSASKSNSKNMITVLDISIDETALLKGYRLVTGVLNEVVINFYESLFNQYPDIKSFFENTSEKEQAEKLSEYLMFLFDNLNNETALKVRLSEMGARHQEYGVLVENHTAIADLLVASFKNKVGRSWTKSISAAWLKLLNVAARTMCLEHTKSLSEGANNNGQNTVIDIMQTKTENVVGKSKFELSESSRPTLKLQPVQDISKSLLLKSEMLALINDTDEIAIYASDVKRIDGSALQLLCALFYYASQNNLIIYWIEPTNELIQSAQALGVQHILELNQVISEAS